MSYFILTWVVYTLFLLIQCGQHHGLIALQAAVDAPKKVHSLSLMEPPLEAFVPSGEEFGSRLQSSVGLYREGKKFESLDSFLRVVFEGSEDYRKFIDKKLGHDAFDNALTILDTIYQLEFPALQRWKFDPRDKVLIYAHLICHWYR